MGYSINIPKLFNDVFGVSGYIVNPQQPNTSVISYPDLPANVETVQAVEKSLMGTPVYEIMQLVDGEETYKFGYTTLVDVNQAKTIQVDKIPGQEGSIKQLITLDDYELTIRGFIIENSPKHPEDKTRELVRWWRKGREVEVIGSVLNNVFGIDYIVLQDSSWPRLEGMPGVQPFQFTAISDIPIEVQLRENNVLIR